MTSTQDSRPQELVALSEDALRDAVTPSAEDILAALEAGQADQASVEVHEPVPGLNSRVLFR